MSPRFNFTVISRNHTPTAAIIVAAFLAWLAVETTNVSDKEMLWRAVESLTLGAIFVALLNFVGDLILKGAKG